MKKLLYYGATFLNFQLLLDLLHYMVLGKMIHYALKLFYYS